MPHEIDRILGAVSASLWMIDPDKAVEIANVLALRAAGQPQDWAGAPNQATYASEPVKASRGNIHVLKMHGTIMPRADFMMQMSGGVSLETFRKAFMNAASDPNAAAIVIDGNTPGGMVDMVPETANMIFKARRPDRPIVAVSNTMIASAGYYLASAADEIVMSPSANIGSIGVYTMHDDLSKRLEEQGVKKTTIFRGARKTERHPFAPLSKEAEAAIQKGVNVAYDGFTADVAKFRGVPVATVRADPENSEEHFGGGRVYHAKEAVRLGMADRIETLDETIQRLAGPRRKRSTRTARARLNLS